ARAVRADDAEGLLRRHVERDVAGRHHVSERLFQIADAQDRRHGAPASRRRSRKKIDPSPSGRNRMVTSRTEPRMICQVPGITSTANERSSSKRSEPTNAAATEAAPARMVTKTNPAEVVQYAMFGSTW